MATFLIGRIDNEEQKDNNICCDAVNVYGETVLHATARGRLGSVAKLLLDQGVNPNAQVS